MQIVRPVIARHPASFGRHDPSVSEGPSASRIPDDLKLFATTFLAGFLFVSILIG
jgi:hypothetical protein